MQPHPQGEAPYTGVGRGRGVAGDWAELATCEGEGVAGQAGRLQGALSTRGP